MKSNQELVEEQVGELEVSRELDVIKRDAEDEQEKEKHCMDCGYGNLDGEKAVCESCAYL